MAIISPKEIKYTRWYLANKKKIQNFIYGILIFLIVLWWGIFTYNLVIYIQGTKLHKENLIELSKNRINYSTLNKNFTPSQISIKDKIALESKKGVYDFLAKINNPNKNWRIKSLDYKFKWNNGETQKKSIFIIPDSNGFATSFQNKSSSLNGLKLLISNIDWKRIKKEDKNKLDVLSKIKISNANVNFMVPQDKMVSMPVVEFTIKNQSLYSFWEVPCLIILFNQADKIVGINQIPVKKLKSEETRSVSLRWSDMPTTYSIQVIPLLNVFDKESYMPIK